MKRTAVFVLCLALALSLTGCGTKTAEDDTSITAAEDLNGPDEPDDPDGGAGTVREDVCALYLEVLEDSAEKE